MSVEKQALIYERAVPVSKERHAKFGVDTKTHRFDFAKSLNAVPIVVGEFASIAREYPIIFVKTPAGPQAMAMVGLRDNENLFVAEDGSWQGHYIPAFLRRYPFVFSKKQDEDSFVLCVDESYSAINENGKGNALFDKDGEASDYLQKMLAFTTTFQREAQATEKFLERLAALEVLRPSEVSFAVGDGKKAKTTGLMSVDREALSDVPWQELVEIQKSGDLELIYTHLFSLGAVDRIGSKLSQ